MSEMRWRGTAAVVVAAVVVLGGCSSGGGGGTADGKPSASAPVEDPSPTDDPLVDDGSADESTDEYPDTPKSEAFDAKAASEGWTVDGYTQASEYVLMMCESMDAWEPGAAQTLAKNQVPDMGAAEKQVLRAGAKPLCPKHASEIVEALGGSVSVRTMSSGTYEIVKGAGLGDDVAPPGTYKTSGDLADCYWERTSKGGSIIDNQYAKAARSISVTVRSGELFTSQDCGTWSLVK
jgi:hypothetical protein